MPPISIVQRFLKVDPAVAAGPLVTAFNDLLGTTLYLVVATALQA